MTTRQLLAFLVLAAGCSDVTPLGNGGTGAGAGGRAEGGAGGGARAPSLPPPIQLVVERRSPPAVDCGLGCRVLLGPTYNLGFPFADTVTHVAETARKELMVRDVRTDEMVVIPAETAFPYMEGPLLGVWVGDEVATSHAFDMAVIDTRTWTEQVYFHHSDYAEYRPDGTTFLTDKYFLFSHAGQTARVDLETGALVDFWPALPRDRGCFGAGAIYYGNGCIYRVDQETFAVEKVDDGGAGQFDPACSPDHQRIVWVDFRDPPGPVSGRLGPRIGGELYVHEFATRETKRLTFDSPTNPITKSAPAISDDVAVWHEPCATCEKNFEEYQNWLGSPKAIVRLELDTQRRCRFEMRGPVGQYSSLQGHRLRTHWLDPAYGGEQYLVEINLDDPAIPWVCE